jgi:hypothetical protein
MVRCIKHKTHVNDCKICKNIQSKSVPFYRFKDIKIDMELDSLTKEWKDYINRFKKTNKILDKPFSKEF